MHFVKYLHVARPCLLQITRNKYINNYEITSNKTNDLTEIDLSAKPRGSSIFLNYQTCKNYTIASESCGLLITLAILMKIIK